MASLLHGGRTYTTLVRSPSFPMLSQCPFSLKTYHANPLYFLEHSTEAFHCRQPLLWGQCFPLQCHPGKSTCSPTSSVSSPWISHRHPNSICSQLDLSNFLRVKPITSCLCFIWQSAHSCYKRRRCLRSLSAPHPQPKNQWQIRFPLTCIFKAYAASPFYHTSSVDIQQCPNWLNFNPVPSNPDSQAARDLALSSTEPSSFCLNSSA